MNRWPQLTLARRESLITGCRSTYGTASRCPRPTRDVA